VKRWHLINDGIFYWDRYLIGRNPADLTMALHSMAEYRTLGGDLYSETESAMRAAAAALEAK
jgi:hypothetical protein